MNSDQMLSNTFSLICFVVSLSRKVTVLSFTDWKSIVIANGVPSSSLREYRRPIELEESSTLIAILSLRSLKALYSNNQGQGKIISKINSQNIEAKERIQFITYKDRGQGQKIRDCYLEELVSI